jgi:hypothetical protein
MTSNLLVAVFLLRLFIYVVGAVGGAALNELVRSSILRRHAIC